MGAQCGAPLATGAGNKVLTWGMPCKEGIWSLMDPGSSLGSVSPPAGETSGPQFLHLLIGD